MTDPIKDLLKLEKYLRKVCFNITRGNEADTKDLLQETMIKGITNIHRWNPEIGPLKNYMVTVAKRLFIDQIRAKKLSTVELDKFDENSALFILPAPDFDAVADVDIMMLAIQKIKKPKVRRVMEMRSKGLPFKEISREIGETEIASRAIAWRAKNKLKETLYGSVGPLRA